MPLRCLRESRQPSDFKVLGQTADSSLITPPPPLPFLPSPPPPPPTPPPRPPSRGAAHLRPWGAVHRDRDQVFSGLAWEEASKYIAKQKRKRQESGAAGQVRRGWERENWGQAGRQAGGRAGKQTRDGDRPGASPSTPSNVNTVEDPGVARRAAAGGGRAAGLLTACVHLAAGRDTQCYVFMCMYFLK